MQRGGAGRGVAGRRGGCSCPFGQQAAAQRTISLLQYLSQTAVAVSVVQYRHVTALSICACVCVCVCVCRSLFATLPNYPSPPILSFGSVGPS